MPTQANYLKQKCELLSPQDQQLCKQLANSRQIMINLRLKAMNMNKMPTVPTRESRLHDISDLQQMIRNLNESKYLYNEFYKRLPFSVRMNLVNSLRKHNGVNKLYLNIRNQLNTQLRQAQINALKV
jgi:hypothetical protein